MADAWGDDSDDEWDVPDDDELDRRLGLKPAENNAAPVFDDEEDLAIREKEEQEKNQKNDFKKKGNALIAKKQAEKERLEEEQIARRLVELEAEAEANMSPEDLKEFKRRQVEEADNALTNDLFGNIDDKRATVAAITPGAGAAAGDKVVLKDLKDHLKHARKVAEAMKAHGKINLAAALLKELLQESKDVLDVTAIDDILKICNIIKNEKVQAAKRKVKGQAQKAKKVDKVAEAKARQLQIETFGDNDNYDDIDEVGANFEDAFF